MSVAGAHALPKRFMRASFVGSRGGSPGASLPTTKEVSLTGTKRRFILQVGFYLL